ncbi:MAG: tetratricopeptide repeat protein [Anaerolineaceae bacterium]|nr:tetratricopeptide repeat protein [Anaerolineaceae bacterium]
MAIQRRSRILLMLGMLVLLAGVVSPLLAQQEPVCDSALTADDFRDRANAAFNQGDMQATLNDLQCVAKLDPQDSVNYNNIGYVSAQMGDAAGARAAYNIAISLNADYLTAYQNRGFLAYQLHEYDNAVADYTEAIRLEPTNAMNYNRRGLAYMDSQRYEQALKDFNQALTLDPTLAAAYNNRGFVYINRQQYEQALADYNQALTLNPELSPITYNDRGMTHYFMNNYDAALVDFAKSIDMDPNYDRPYNNRGWLYLDTKKPDLALADFNEALRLTPDYVDALAGRGNAYYALGRGAEALADYLHYAELSNSPSETILARIEELQAQVGTTNPPVVVSQTCDTSISLEDYRAQADTQFEAGDYAGMAATYTCMLEIAPDDPVFLVNRGLANLRSGNIEAAVEDYSRALEFDPNNATIYNNRGYAYNTLRQPELAIPDFLKALEIDPTRSAAADGLGTAYYQAGQLEDALASYQRYVELRGSDAHPDVLQLITNLEAQINLDLSNCDPSYTQNALSQTGAQVLQSNGAPAALPIFECAVQNEPENSMAYSDRGFVLYQLDNWNGALRDYARAIELDSTNAFPRANRGELYLRLGRYQDAFYDYIQALNNSSGGVAPAIYYGLGLALDGMEQYDDAAQALDLLTSATRGRTGLTPAMLAEVERIEGITGQSITGAIICDGRAVIGDVINSARDYNRQASQALGDADYQAALDAFNCSLVFNPFSPGAYTSRAYVNAKLGNYDDALADVDRALELYPENPVTYANLGYIYNLQGNPADALTAAETALEFNPDSGDALMVRGESYYLLGRYEESLADFQHVEAIVKAAGGNLPQEVVVRLAELPGLVGGESSNPSSSTSGAPALALTQTLVGAESGMTLNYPDGWFGVEASADILGLANSPTAFQTMVEGLGDSLPPPSGQFHVIVYTTSVIGSVVETLDEAVTVFSPTDLLSDVGEMTAMTVNGLEIRYGSVSLDDRDVVRILVDTGKGIALIRATAAPGEMGDYEATLMAIVGSITMK